MGMRRLRLSCCSLRWAPCSVIPRSLCRIPFARSSSFRASNWPLSFGDLGIQASPLDLGTHEMADRRHELVFPLRVRMEPAMLQVEHADQVATCQDRHG